MVPVRFSTTLRLDEGTLMSNENFYDASQGMDPEDPFYAGLSSERPVKPGEVRRLFESEEVAEARLQEQKHVDLGWLLTGGTPPLEDPPEFLLRDDDAALFYAGKYNLLYGDPEAGKTWIALAAVAGALQAGKRCVFFDLDHNGAGAVAGRLVRLGAPVESVASSDMFRLYSPQSREELDSVIFELLGWRPDGVVVMDSLGELLPMMGLKSNSNDEVTYGLRSTVVALAEVGAAVIAIDHQTKSKAEGTGFSVGAGAKKRMANGAVVHAEVQEFLAPGRVGRIKLFVHKDRPGRVREFCTSAFFGVFVLDSTGEDVSLFNVEVPTVSGAASADSFRPTVLMGRVSAALESAGEALSKNQIAALVKGKKLSVLQAVDSLHVEGFISEVVVSGNIRFQHVRPFNNPGDEPPAWPSGGF